MAYSILFSGFKKGKKKAAFHIEPHALWWDIAELLKAIAPNWVVTNETGSYEDEDADISLDEARKLHQLFKPKLLRLIEDGTESIERAKTRTDKYAAQVLADDTTYVERLNAELETIESALGKDAGSFSHFHICIFEWDTGM